MGCPALQRRRQQTSDFFFKNQATLRFAAPSVASLQTTLTTIWRCWARLLVRTGYSHAMSTARPDRCSPNLLAHQLAGLPVGVRRALLQSAVGVRAMMLAVLLLGCVVGAAQVAPSPAASAVSPSAGPAASPVPAPPPPPPPAIMPAAAELPANWSIGVIQNPGDEPPTTSKSAAWTDTGDTPAGARQYFDLAGNVPLWLRLSHAPSLDPNTAYLQVAYPHMATVKLYRQLRDGSWQIDSAGMDTPLTEWPVVASMPTFKLSSAADTPVVYWLRVMHSHEARTQVLVRDDEDALATERTRLMRVGLLYGMFTLGLLYNLLQAVLHRTPLFGAVAAYTALAGVAAAAVDAYAPIFFWPNSVFLAQTMRYVLPLWMLGAFALLAYWSSHVARSDPWTRVLLPSVGVLCVAAGVLCFFLAPPMPRGAHQLLCIVSMFLILGCCLRLLRRHNQWAGALALSLVPSAVVTVIYFAATRNVGDMDTVSRLQALPWAMLAHVIILSMALSLRMRRDWSVQARADTAGDVDLLTGLTLPDIALQRRWPAQLKRAQYSNTQCAALMVHWTNRAAVLEQAGHAGADRMATAWAARLVRLRRDIDLVCRIDDANFVVLLDAPTHRDEVTQMSIKIITEGLRVRNPAWLNLSMDAAVISVISGREPCTGEQLITQLRSGMAQMLARAGNRRTQTIDLP